MLKQLKANNIISEYSETHNKTKEAHTIPIASYAAVIQGVEFDITDQEISKHLAEISINHKFCRLKSNWEEERLLNEGIYFKHRHYPVYTSPPPAPIPVPCAKCMEYTQTTANCTNPIKCTKCFGTHHTNSFNSPLPPKCRACQSEDYHVWSMKCPKRPTASIEGIPNAKIRSLNKPSAKIDPKLVKQSRIHKPITIHDHIVTTYLNKLNKRQNTNRPKLTEEGRKKKEKIHW